MSERILDFGMAEEQAKRDVLIVDRIQASHRLYRYLESFEVALEAQAQARLAVERAIRQRAEDRWEAAATEAAEMRQRAEAAEAKLARVREYVQECERESLPPLLHHLTEMLND